MPEGTAPAEEDRPQVAPGSDEVEGEAVLHPDPVRIPVGALPSAAAPRTRGPAFIPALVVGLAGAPWFAGALWIGSPAAVLFASGWLAALVLSLGMELRGRNSTGR